MANVTDHPFQPGVVVAIYGGVYGLSITQGKVAKVHKNGRFLLEDSDQQFKARSNGSEWFASRTSRYSRGHIELWTDKTDAQIAQQACNGKCRNLAKKISDYRHKEDGFTEAQLAALEACLAALEGDAS